MLPPLNIYLSIPVRRRIRILRLDCGRLYVCFKVVDVSWTKVSGYPQNAIEKS